MKKLLLAAALLTLIPVMARAATFHQWPGIGFMDNPPETYSMVIITTAGTQCPGRGPGTHVTVGFDGHQGTPVYSCRSVGVSQTWDYHPRFTQADVGIHTITVTVGDTATTHSFGGPMAGARA